MEQEYTLGELFKELQTQPADMVFGGAREFWLRTACTGKFLEACRGSLREREREKFPTLKEWRELLNKMTWLDENLRKHHLRTVQTHLKAITAAITIVEQRSDSNEVGETATQLAGTNRQTPRRCQIEDMVRFLACLTEDQPLCDLEFPLYVMLDGKGARLSIKLEALTPRGQCIYPHPNMAFVQRDRAFDGSIRAAANYARNKSIWPADTGVRWSVTQTHGDFITALKQDSGGAAFALGLVKVLACAAAKRAMT